MPFRGAVGFSVCSLAGLARFPLFCEGSGSGHWATLKPKSGWQGHPGSLSGEEAGDCQGLNLPYFGDEEGGCFKGS